MQNTNIVPDVWEIVTVYPYEPPTYPFVFKFVDDAKHFFSQHFSGEIISAQERGGGHEWKICKRDGPSRLTVSLDSGAVDCVNATYFSASSGRKPIIVLENWHPKNYASMPKELAFDFVDFAKERAKSIIWADTYGLPPWLSDVTIVTLGIEHPEVAKYIDETRIATERNKPHSIDFLKTKYPDNVESALLTLASALYGTRISKTEEYNQRHTPQVERILKGRVTPGETEYLTAQRLGQNKGSVECSYGALTADVANVSAVGKDMAWEIIKLNNLV